MRQRFLPLLLLLLVWLCAGCDGEVDDDTADDDTAYVAPTWCDPVLEAIGLDDGSPLADEPPAWVAGPLRLLVVTSPLSDDAYDDLRSLMVLIDGLGFGADYVEADGLSSVSLGDYSSVLVASSAWDPVVMGSQEQAQLAQAVADGTDLMWLGVGVGTTLDATFGVQWQEEVSTVEMGITSVRFADLHGQTVETPAYDDFLDWVEVESAAVWATFEPSGLPAVTVHRESPTAGRTILVPFALLHYWGEGDTDDTWSRAAALAELLTLLRSRGAVRLEAFPDGHVSAFGVRFEDIHPGGERFFLYEEWVDRFERVTLQLDAWDVPVHLGVVARFVDPGNDEDNGWKDPHPTRERLRALITHRLSFGDVLVSHGWTHQYGVGETDYTGVDWEFSDDATGDWIWLPYDEQLQRIESARDELRSAFGVVPSVWETPHLDGNPDTYLAAAEAGFTVVNEGDTQLFPNRWGEENRVGGALLNVPHTGGFVPEVEAGAFVELSIDSLLPRLIRMRAPSFVFYHGYNDDQELALLDVAACAVHGGLWLPRVSELADWWTERAGAAVEASLQGDDRLAVTVSDHPAGATVDVRLPDGTEAVAVTLDGEPIDADLHHMSGVAHVRVILPGERTSSQVEVALTIP